MKHERETSSALSQRSSRQERADRILDVAGDLLLRHGYNRITIEDIARKAEVGKGTIYLHWRTREALFGTLMLREVLAFWQELLPRLRADPTEALFHRVMRSLMLIGMGRPLGRVLLTGDRELLGKLAESGFGGARQSQQTLFKEGFLALLRRQGLLRSDTDPAAQQYALRATVTGFLLIDPFLAEEEQLPLEEKAEALAQTVRRAFEPEDPLPPAALRQAASVMIEWLEQLCAFYEQRLREQVES